MIKVLVNGAKGRMGIETVTAIKNAGDLELVGTADMGDSLDNAIASMKPDVVVDFTNPDSVLANAWTILNSGCHAVVGTTGLSETDLKQLRQVAEQNKVCIAVCPNFAIGAILMMRFAAEAARYLKKAEIIEMHHDKKIDAPSGTAIKTAELISESNPEINKEKIAEKEIVKGAGAGLNAIFLFIRFVCRVLLQTKKLFWAVWARP